MSGGISKNLKEEGYFLFLAIALVPPDHPGDVLGGEACRKDKRDGEDKEQGEDNMPLPQDGKNNQGKEGENHQILVANEKPPLNSF